MRTPADDGLDLICYCREPEGALKLIQCSNPYCLIGWFHLECAEYEEDTAARFYCEFCADLPHYSSEEERLGSEDEAEQDHDDVEDSRDDMGDYVENEDEDERMDTTPEDETPRTPSPKSKFFQYLSSPYTGSPTGFITINPRPDMQSSSTTGFGLDGVFEKPRSTSKSTFSSSATKSWTSIPVTFEDLAPFISYKEAPPSPSGLTYDEILKLEGWRYCLPESRLFAVFRREGTAKIAGIPYGPRRDLRTLAQQGVDRTLSQGERERHVFRRLSKWLSYEHR